MKNYNNVLNYISDTIAIFDKHDKDFYCIQITLNDIIEFKFESESRLKILELIKEFNQTGRVTSYLDFDRLGYFQIDIKKIKSIKVTCLDYDSKISTYPNNKGLIYNIELKN